MGRKEELKADYKHNRHLLRRMGVFRITNLVNGKVYLGGSLNLDGTMERDRKWLAMGGHLNHRLQRDWNEFGAEAFDIEVLETLPPADEPRDYAADLAVLLECWMEALKPYGDRGYFPVPRRP